jgi:iron complex outermembrane receptor protein
MPTGSFELNPTNLSYTTYSAFIQDRIEILNNELYFTFGTKFEDNELTGGEIQPTARLLWKIDPQQTFWSSLTRAVRTPTRADLHAQLNFGGPPIIISDPYSQTDSVVATEVGYRSQALNNTLIDIAVFNHNYSDHNSDSIRLDQTYGLEAVVNHEVSKNWRLETSYTWHKGTILENGNTTNNDRIPRNSLNIRSLLDITPQWELDTFIFYRDALNLNALDYEDYIRLDIRVGWNHIPDLRTSFTITNLLDDKHIESSDPQRINTAVSRGILLNISVDLH